LPVVQSLVWRVGVAGPTTDPSVRQRQPILDTVLDSSSSGAARLTKDRRTRSQAWQLAGTFSGIVAVVASWLIAVRKI